MIIHTTKKQELPDGDVVTNGDLLGLIVGFSIGSIGFAVGAIVAFSVGSIISIGFAVGVSVQKIKW